MELQQLRYVVAVVDEGTFTAAARACFVVQSALSHQVAALEREVGVRLFARSSRRVELTVAGRAFVPVARRCLAEAEQAVAAATLALGEVSGRLDLSVIPTVQALDLPLAVRQLVAEHPRVEVHLEVRQSDQSLDLVARGEVDLAFLGLPEDDAPTGVASMELGRDAHVALLPANHDLAEADTLSLAEMAGERFADFPVGSPGRRQTDQAFTAVGIHRFVPFEVTTPDLMVGLVRQGLALSLLPSRVARSAGIPVREAGQVVKGDHAVMLIPVRDGPHRVEHLVWSSFNPSPATIAFVDVVGRLIR